MLSKLSQISLKVTEKMVLDSYIKNQPLYIQHLSVLEKALQKHLIDKHRFDNSTKLEYYFEQLNPSLIDAAKKIPKEGVFRTVLNNFAESLKVKVEKKLLGEIDQVFSAFTTHFKNVRSNLEKSMVSEGFLVADIDYSWGDKPTDRCSYDRVLDIRKALIGKYSEIINLDFAKNTSKMARPPILKIWETKHSPILLANLNHLKAVDEFLKRNILPIKRSLLFKFGHQFNLPKVLGKLYKAFIKLLLKMVWRCDLDGPRIPFWPQSKGNPGLFHDLP
jgi:hypothetical protein